MLAVAVVGFADQPEDHARPGRRRKAAVPAESVRRDRRRHEAPARTTAAVADRAGHLLLLVPGRAAPDGPAAASATKCCRVSDNGVSLLMGLPRHRHRRGQHAGRPPLRRQGGARPGAAGLDLHGSLRARAGGGAPAPIALVDRRGRRCSAMASGLFIVPLNAYLQQRSESQRKGPHRSPPTTSTTPSECCWPRPCCGCCTTSCTCSADGIMLIFGIVTLAVTVYIVTVVPDFLIRFVLWLLTHTVFRIRIVGAGERAVPRPGAAGVESHVARRRLPDRRLRAALHPLHGVEALLRDEGAATGSSA